MEPKYQQNLGYIARVSKNFGVERLVLINPRCNYNGREAIKYSKHARELLENAKIVKRLDGLKDDLLIGTTGIWHKTNASYYNIYDLDSLSRIVKRAHKAGKGVTLLLGRDDTGLSKEELRLCDATVFIRTNKDYPILNISHALAIILSRFNDEKTDYNFIKGIYADATSEKRLILLFERLLKENPKVRDSKSVSMAFRHIVRRSIATKKEISALSIAFSPSEKGRKIKR